MVKSLSQLDRYRWSGHSVLMGKIENDWQDRDYVLKWFGKAEGQAKDANRHYVKKAIGEGRRAARPRRRQSAKCGAACESSRRAWEWARLQRQPPARDEEEKNSESRVLAVTPRRLHGEAWSARWPIALRD